LPSILGAEVKGGFEMTEQKYEIGMVGLGVMGRNLLLNMADKGYSVAGFDLDKSKVEALRTEAETRNILGAESLAELMGLLRTPRAVMLLVPAGSAVDAVIRDVLPHLKRKDIIIDGGNSFFKDTEKREKTLAEKGIDFLGLGVSGGAEGARHGPSMMPGGARAAYNRVRPVLEAAAAKVNGDPCITYLGPGGAGHYVKMVHNGIEYALMQLIAETYDLMHHGLELNNDELHDVYTKWNQGELQSFLVEITAHIFHQKDPKTGKHLVDVILDKAAQKGTGMWTSQGSMDLHLATPTIDMAVAMRDLSALKEEREAAAKVLQGPVNRFQGDRKLALNHIRNAFYAAMVITYAQGMALLRRASDIYDYNLNLEAVARIWRGGCIIRAALLEDIRKAFKGRREPTHLLLDPPLGKIVISRQADLRAMIHMAVELGLPAPAFAVTLAYFDAYRRKHLPANLIQAQRDYFGAHTYQRIDEEGTFHTEWNTD
jgi:6-phosphogluconate dehydrogenase